MCVNNGDGVVWLLVFVNGECDDGGVVMGEIVFVVGVEGRCLGVVFVNESVVGFFEVCGGGGDGVVG